MINKKNIILLFITLVVLLSGCTNSTYEGNGINIFDHENNIVNNFIPEAPVKISTILGEERSVMIINNDGSMIVEDVDFEIKVDGSTIVAKRGNSILAKDVISIYSGKEIKGIGNLYHDTYKFLEEDKKVVAVILDGFSYEQYRRLVEDGRIPFFESIFKEKAISVYNPVTNAGFASMITGTLPPENGVHNRSFRDLKVKSIFFDALDMNKKAVLLEGDIKILNTEIEPILHVDLNSDGEVDDEIFQTALSLLNDDIELLFIHFHGIDDRGHTYGPYADETLNYIVKIDGYMKRLDELWDGIIIATADHGMNEKEDGGDHGDCTYEDMIVPYFLKENFK